MQHGREVEEEKLKERGRGNEGVKEGGRCTRTINVFTNGLSDGHSTAKLGGPSRD